MKQQKTLRGFDLYSFIDRYGAECSIQKSSLAEEDAIWLGVDNANPKIMAVDAREAGISTTAVNGWVEYPIPDTVIMTTRMHLTQDQVAKLLPVLQRFVDTGEIE